MLGQTFSHYKVTVKLGEGGMGEVYLAEDTSLNRKVALKFLPEQMREDDVARKRFLREARSAAALNHAYICNIFEIGEVQGRDFIAMEYIPGRTLAQRLSEGPLPLKEALRVAREVAEALEQAHRNEIVHRDLKPSNIMITPEGHAKVMDFGLAKQLPADGEGGRENTLTALTDLGSAAGTPGYMSPEQLRGEEVDTRSDIFSFGIVLYEMLTGVHPFRKTSVMATATAIQTETPPPMARYAENIPELVQHTVAKMLAKDVDRRYASIHDARTNLQQLLEDSVESPAAAPARARSWRWLPWAGVAAAAFVGVAAALYWLHRDSTTPESPATAPQLVPLTSYPGIERQPTFSPDSSQVGFSWTGRDEDNTDIYITVLGSEEPRRLTSDPAVDASPAWSPDGRQIAFLRETAPGRSEVRLISPNGGPERVLATVATAPHRGLSWSSDSRTLAVPDQPSGAEAPGIFLLDAESGEKKRLTTTPSDSAVGDWLPTFSPDGRTLAFFRRGGAYSLHVFLVPVAGGEPQRLSTTSGRVGDSSGGLAWTSSGKEIIFTAPPSFPNVSVRSSILLWRISTTDRRAERLAESQNALDVVVSRSGNRLAFSNMVIDWDIWRIDLHDKDKTQTKFITSTQMDLSPQFSPDGRQIVFSSLRSGNQELWRADQDGSNLLRLTSLGAVGSPRWSPDGKAIAFDHAQEEARDLYVIGSAGGLPRRITRNPASDVRPSWSNDGAWIYFGSNRSGEWQVWKIPAAGEEKGAARQITRGGGRTALESTDGKFVYFSKQRSTEESPQNAIWRIPVEGGEEQPVIESLESSDTNWDVTAEGIYFVDRASTAGRWGVYFLRFADGSVTRASQLEHAPFRSAPAFSVSFDGRWILSAQWQSRSDLMLLENFR